MPPRRSTRSTRASVEPQEVAKPSLSKRKRGEPAEPPVADQENIKPAARTRRSTSTTSIAPSASKTRVYARSKKQLEEVPETDEDEDEEQEEQAAPPPARKKSRPSLESDDAEEEFAAMKPRRKAPARKPSRAQAGPSAVKEDDDTPSTGRRSVVPRRTGRSSTRTASSTASRIKGEDSADIELEDLPVDDASDEAQERKIVKKERRKPVSRVVNVSDEEDASGVKRPTGRKTRKARITRTPSPDEAPEEGADPLEESEESREKKDDPVSADEEEIVVEDTRKTSAIADPENSLTSNLEEEEHSLLDAPVPPPSQPQLQTQPAIPEEPQGPKPRLVIHKMALVNFKSYAGRQEIGPFHKSFSAIVGPNGSGKSNTIDALLFVFGYRASKMRQGKLSELIHNSARYPDLEDCSVEVHFREIIDLPGPNAFEVVPNSTLVVARTAYKNNSSRYTINGQQSNYKEVQTLLKGRGIDLDHNRFLILQGEVESIAQMKPKAATEHEDGLLEYLEDIIGTSKYKEPIDEALVEMERLSEERVEKMNRLRIVERERKALEAKKREAEDYLRLQNEHIRAQSRLWQWYIWRCLTNDEQYQDRILQIETELAEETERNQDDIAHLEALEKHFKERCAAYEELKAAAAEAIKDLAVHEKKQVGLEERRKHSSSKLKKLKKTLQDDEHALAEAQRSLEDSAEKIESEREKIEEFEASLVKEEKILEEIRDSLKDKTQVFHDKIEVKQKELQPWTAKINAKQAEIDLATSERDMLAKKAEGVKEAYEEARKALEKLQEDQEAKTSELAELKASKANKQKDLKAGEKDLQDARARVQELRGSASSLRQKAEEAKASQAANTSQNKVLDSLTRLKNAGRINGFHGRLGSLGTIPDKYDVAVSTACGALNNLVVDTVDQGQACIEYLRKQNVGRASFLVLEKLSHNGLDKIQTPENVPRLFDLIKPKEPRFAPAFFKGVGNTLVAEDLDQANRIAFGGQRRWRVVTLAGQLIDSSGTMSGGGNHVARGGMSSKLAAESVSPDVLKKYERDSEQASLELEQALQRLRELEAEMERLGQSGPQMDMTIEKVNLDIQTGAKRIAEAEKRVKELKSQSKPDARDMARITALEESISRSTEELEGLQEKTGAIEEEIKALEKKILEIGGARLLAQKSKVDGIRLHINLGNEEITKAEVAKMKAEKDSTKLSKAIDTNSKNCEEVEGELEELNEQLEKVSRYVNEIRSKVDQAQGVADKSKDDLDSLKAELDEKTEEIQAFRQKEMELQQSLNDVNKEASDNKRSLDHWTTEHDNLKLEDIDDDDEEEDAEGTAEAPATGEQPVKQESEDEPKVKRKRERTPSHELHIYSAEELATFKKRELIADSELLDEKLKNAKPDMRVLKDYRKREEEFLRRAQDLDQVTEQRDAKKQEYDNLRKQRLDEFMSGFSTISLKLKEMYQMITLGGNAELELVDSMDPFSEGIIFSVMPPKKSWKNISNLSGGEKTLSSLALVFALHVYKPTPLYFMDEIDAALDFRNVSIVANYIKDRTKNAQFIIISLRNDMFELSHRLIGIYKTANATRSISIDNHALHAIPVNTVAAV